MGRWLLGFFCHSSVFVIKNGLRWIQSKGPLILIHSGLSLCLMTIISLPDQSMYHSLYINTRSGGRSPSVVCIKKSSLHWEHTAVHSLNQWSDVKKGEPSIERPSAIFHRSCLCYVAAQMLPVSNLILYSAFFPFLYLCNEVGHRSNVQAMPQTL